VDAISARHSCRFAGGKKGSRKSFFRTEKRERRVEPEEIMSLRDPLGRGGDKSDEAPKDVETRRLPSSRPQLRGPRAGSAGRRQGALHCVQPEWSTGFVWPGCQTVLLTLEERWSDLGSKQEDVFDTGASHPDPLVFLTSYAP